MVGKPETESRGRLAGSRARSSGEPHNARPLGRELSQTNGREPLRATKRLRFWLLYTLPPILFFSYYPLISFGSSDSMNFELSLPLIWLVLYDLVSLVAFVRAARTRGLRANLRGLSDAKFFIFSLFPLFATLSSLWSPNPTRALLTSGLIWALFIAIFSTYELLVIKCCKNYNTFWQKFKKILYISTAVICVFCWLQCILDLAGLPRECTLLCQGCTYRSFGFPHPNGFAIEPQFMGNLLLAPILILLCDIIYARRRQLSPLLFLFLITLFLTFSRGAIYAFAIAFAIILVTRFVQTKSAKPLASLVLVVAAFLTTLLAQGLMAELSPTNDSFASGIAKSIHQLSLGKIDLRSTTPVEPVENSAELVENPVENSSTASASNSSSFDGYVADSTNIRVKLTAYALNLWHQSPQNFLFGVGIGGAGVTLSQAYPAEYTAKEIIQNEYASLLLETGIIGLALLATSIVFVLRRVYRTKARSPGAKPLFISLALAYAVSLLFFSGLANALHIYLLLALTLINVLVGQRATKATNTNKAEVHATL